MSIRTRAVAIGAATAAALAVAAAPALAQKSTTVTVTTPKSNPMAFTLKAGTYTFKYVNNSGIPHNLKVGSSATPVFANGSKTVKVTLKKGATVAYECTPHKTVMKGTIKVT